MQQDSDASLEERIQQVLDEYRPTLYIDGGDVELLRVDEAGVAHVKMLGACIDCPISLLTMKLGIKRLLKENFTEIVDLNAITDIDISALYNRPAPVEAGDETSTNSSFVAGSSAGNPLMAKLFRSKKQKSS